MSRIKDYCSLKSWKKRFPISLWLPGYSLNYLVNDLIAGLTVALTVIPQSLAYASIAKLEIQYGLYSAFMGCFVYCIFGTSKDITVGPTAILSLLVATYGHQNPKHPTLNDAQLAIILAFLCGIVQFIMGILHLGALTGFISAPVISGFTSASAISIALGQVKHILGISFSSDTALETVEGIFRHITETNFWDLLLGLSCAVILLLLQKVQRDSVVWMEEQHPVTPKYLTGLRKTLWFVSTARNALIVGSASLLAWSLDEAGHGGKITTTGEMKEGIPVPRFPDFRDHSVKDIVSELNVGLIVVPLIAYLEAIAIGKAFARKNGYKVEPNQEMLAVGLCNIAGSFFSSYPVTGSFSRTAINSQCGVKTPLGGLVTGSLVLLALAYLTPIFQYIPKAALAAVIIVAVLKMFNYRIFITLWRVNKLDLVPLTVTFVASLLLAVQYGTIIGVIIDLIILLVPVARPELKVVNPGSLTRSEEDGLLNVERGSPLVQESGGKLRLTPRPSDWDVKWQSQERDGFDRTPPRYHLSASGRRGGKLSRLLIHDNLSKVPCMSLGGFQNPWFRSTGEDYCQVDRYPVLIVQVDRAIRYPSAENLVDRLNEIRESKVYYQQHVIFDFARTTEIDFTAIECLSDAISDFSKAGVKLLLVNVKLDIHDMLHRANIQDLEIYPSVAEAVQSLSGSGDT